MKPEIIRKFKKIFEEQHQAIIKTHGTSHAGEEFAINRDEMMDEVDWTSTELEQSMKMRMKSREVLFLKKIEAAMKRIQEGTFGQCSDCGDEIGTGRLMARPTATLCISCKEEQERKEMLHIDGHRAKSLGHGFKPKSSLRAG